MSKVNRQSLKDRFKTGMRPTQTDFENLVDSQINALEDGISLSATKNLGIGVADPKEKLQVGGALTIGDTVNASPDTGTIKFDGAKFQGFAAGAWMDLGGGGGDSFWKKTVPAVNNISYAVGGDEVDINVKNSNPSLLLKGKHPVSGAISEFSISADALSNQLSFKGNSFLFLGTNDSIFMSISPSDDVVEISTSAGAVITCAGNSVHIPKLKVESLDTSSDVRLKKNITPFVDGLNQLTQLNPVKFTYNGLGGTTEGESHIGLIAQDIQQVLPDLVGKQLKKLAEDDTGPTELLSVKPLELLYLAINSIKELQQKIESLESKVELLQGRHEKAK